jgi:hypothetical protein
MLTPSRPTYFANVDVTLASIDTRLRHVRGSTSSRYAAGWRSKREKQGRRNRRPTSREMTLSDRY